MPKPRRINVCVLGDSGVGKTALSVRLEQNCFISRTQLTIGVENWILRKVEFNGNKKFEVRIADTAGTEKYADLQTPYFRRADCCLLTFDLYNRESFKSLSSWRNRLLAHCKHHISDDFSFPFVLIGNKSDLPSKGRQVSFDEADKWARNLNMPYYEASAKSGMNVEMCLAVAIRRLMDFEEVYHTEDPHLCSTIKIYRPEEQKKGGVGCCWCGGNKPV